MTPTRPRLLVALVVVSAAVGWGVVRLVDAYADRSLPVPWTASLVMLLLAIALALWARGTRARLEHRPGTKPMDPVVAARSAALAMAASRTGAIVAGFYAGAAIGLWPGWDVAYVRERIVISLVTVLFALLVVVAALWLERVCRVPPDSPEDPNL
jgi:heme A synthase